MIRQILSVASACALGACAARPIAGTMPAPIVDSTVEHARARWPEVTAESLARGRELFIARCRRCHVLPDRRAYSDERWPKILGTMGPRAKLDAVEQQQVLRFILADRDANDSRAARAVVTPRG
ncbi:MAG TPA: hypothetical protein VIV40_23025 [Kofleriaceae bacterium]